VGQRGEVFTTKTTTTSEKRTYFFNVKENRLGDLFLTIVESKKHGESDFERHQVMVFEEDLEGFARSFEEAAAFIRRSRDPRRGRGKPRN
jgi:hypothetical protein